MSSKNGARRAPEPQWIDPFLAALRAEPRIRAAARTAGVPPSTAYHRRKMDPDFAREWDEACGKLPGENGRADTGTDTPGWGGKRRIGAKKIDRFIEALAESSNVRAAAEAAGLDPRKVYRLRRNDPEFARAWYAALAEGYDNLEMEMLEHLRAQGDRAQGEDAAGAAPSRKFDTATALRCLTAHRENVAREKGRRALADEVTTIASINAKIDLLRSRARANDKAIRKARRKAAPDAGR